MKRTVAMIAACILLLPVFALCEPLGQGSQRVFDNARLMSENEITRLENTIASLRRQYDMDFAVLTSNDVKPGRSREFADDFYDSNGFGTGSDFSGVLFLIDMSNREFYVSTSGLMIRYVTDARLDALLDTAYSYLAEGKHGDAAYAALNQLSVYLKNGIPSNQYNQDEEGHIDRYVKPRAVTMGEAAIALAAGLAGALILYFAVLHKYAMKSSAYKYDLKKNADANITGATDVYLRTQVTRVPRSSSNSGGGGFGGRSGTHRSSGGRIHGGGGRKF